MAALRELDFHGAELAIVDTELAFEALGDSMVARLMGVPGIDAIAGISIVAAIGDVSRFDDPNKLVAYAGIDPWVLQSGNAAPVHGRIGKTGRTHVRGVLVEAAWSAGHPDHRALYQRVKARRGLRKAVVATARKMTVLAWHIINKGQDCAFARPSVGWSLLTRLA